MSSLCVIINIVLLLSSVLGQNTVSNPLQVLVEYFKIKGVSSVVYVTGGRSSFNEKKNVVKHFIECGFYIDIIEERNIYQLNLNQNFKTGVVIAKDCQHADSILIHIERKSFFKTNNYFLFIVDTFNETLKNSLEKRFIPPNGEVRVLVANRFEEDKMKLTLIDYYKIHEKAALKESVICENCIGVECLVAKVLEFEPAMVKRKNLEGIYFKAGLVIAFPDVFTTIDDLNMKHIDTITKANYPISQNLRDDLNISYNIMQVDNFGWSKNGTFDGLMGLFQLSQIECGSHAIFMRSDRIPLVDYTAETFTVRACIMFRQPPLSAVSNIFILPFTLEVWTSLLIFLVVASVAMIAQLWQPAYHLDIDVLDCIHFVWGAMCQQGFATLIVGRSARILVFTTFITALFLFNSYSANIVALLQSPSESIRTVSDLVVSPLEMGVQDTAYNKIYFKETTNPSTQKLFQRKIFPKGESVFMRPTIGVQKVRHDLFAYQVEAHAAYKIISDTFSEHEKCGLKELEAFRLPIMAVPVLKNFSYTEIFRQRLRWQREIGLMNREVLKWIPQKPVCATKVAGFVSVGLTEFKYALQMFVVGATLSMVVLILEITYYKLKQFFYNKQTIIAWSD